MSKARALFVLTVVGLAGAAIGAGATVWFISADLERMSLARTQFAVAKNILILEALRSGKLDDAKQFLEVQIDADVVSLDNFVRDKSLLSDDADSSIVTVAEYRSRVTYEPSSAASQLRVPEILKAAKERQLTRRSTATPKDSAR